MSAMDGMVEANHARAIRMAEISLKQNPDIILLREAFAASYCGKTNLSPLGFIARKLNVKRCPYFRRSLRHDPSLSRSFP